MQKGSYRGGLREKKTYKVIGNIDALSEHNSQRRKHFGRSCDGRWVR